MGMGLAVVPIVVAGLKKKVLVSLLISSGLCRRLLARSTSLRTCWKTSSNRRPGVSIARSKNCV
jgi:hypothetical protein